METDIFAQLRQDHWRVYDLMRQWIAQGHGEGKTAADQVSNLFLPHAKAEEVGLYAALREHETARPHLAQAVEEHRVIEYRIRELVHVTPGHQDQLRARLAEVRELIRRHAGAEEEITFALARELLSDEAIRDLGRRFPIDKERFRQQYWMAA